MRRKMTVIPDDAVCEDLQRPHLLASLLDEGYRAMAPDMAREAEAQEWCNALAGDNAPFPTVQLAFEKPSIR